VCVHPTILPAGGLPFNPSAPPVYKLSTNPRRISSNVFDS
jgi:hypothetical protein